MRIRSPLLTRILSWLLAKACRLSARTIRYNILELVPGTNPADPDCPDHYVFAVWHDQVMIPITARARIRRHTEGNRISALVSRHQDGSYLTEFMKQFSIGAVRGSTSRGGATALRQLLTRSGSSHIWITPDGPRGPRHEIKPGAIFVASQTGMPIILNANAATRYWDLQGSWTNLIVPKPFSTTYLLMSKPIPIPPDLSREQIDEYQNLLEREMERLQNLVDRLASGELSELPRDDEQAAVQRAA